MSLDGRPLWTSPARQWDFYADFLGQGSAEPSGSFPDFLIVAPPKTGTTWVAAVLGQHKDIFVPPEKEVHYFDNAWRRQSLSDYAGAFSAAGARVKGEATPTYALLPPTAIRAIHAALPALKIVMLVRRPPERMWSHLRHCAIYREDVFRDERAGLAAIDHRTALCFALGDYGRSCTDYAAILDRWAGVFGDSQVFLGEMESFVAAPEREFSRLFRFLGVEPPADWGDFPLREPRNVGPAFTPPPGFMAALESIYRGPAADLAAQVRDRFGVGLSWDWPAGASGPWPAWVAEHPVAGNILFDGKNFVAGDRRADTLGGLRSGLDGAGDRDTADRRLGHLIDTLADDMRRYGVPRPMGDLLGFNLFASETRALAVDQGLGDVDFEGDDATLRARFAPDQVMIGQTIGEVAARVVALHANREQANLARDIERVRHDMTAQRLEIDTRFVEMEKALAERSMRLSGVETSLVERTDRLRALEVALPERTDRLRALEVALSERTDRLRALEVALSERTDRLRAAEEALSERTRRLSGLETTMAERTERLAKLENDLAGSLPLIQGLAAQVSANKGNLRRLDPLLAGFERVASRIADAERVAAEAAFELAVVRRQRLERERAEAEAALRVAQAGLAAANARRAPADGWREAVEQRLNALTRAFKSAQ